MLIVTFWTQLFQGFLEIEKIFTILSTRSVTFIDFGSHLRLTERSEELRIVRHTNINQASDVLPRRVGRVKWCVLYTVAVYLSYIEIFLDFFDLAWNDVIRCTLERVSPGLQNRLDGNPVAIAKASHNPLTYPNFVTFTAAQLPPLVMIIF